MKLTVLVDNNTFDFIPPFLLGQSAISILVEAENLRTLFDVGVDDTIIKNACALNIDLSQVNQIVLSHSHVDHTQGLEFLSKIFDNAKKMLIAHPHAFLKRFYPDIHGIQIGIPIPISKIKEKFEIIEKIEPYWLDKNLCFLSEIPRIINFEIPQAIGVLETKEEDFNLDDSALVYKSTKGLVVITGCSHSGICNIIEYAKKVCKENKIHDVIGGFHLLNPEAKQLEGTLEYFKNLKADVIHPCHCTDLRSKIELSKVANIEEVGSGLILKYN